MVVTHIDRLSSITTTVLGTTEWVGQPAQASLGKRSLAFSCWTWGYVRPQRIGEINRAGELVIAAVLRPRGQPAP